MITYGFSLQGKSHIQKGVVCQDSHRIERLKNGWNILVIADGVGSAKHSEDGSRIAADMVAQYCKKNIISNMAGEQIIEIINKSYQMAFRQIELFCQGIDGQIEDYDTTLSTAIYTGSKVYFGHAGDGGIIVKDTKGHYEMITVPQKGVDGISVRPLRSGSDSWQFGITDNNIAAVLLATDGMLDTLLPPLLNMKQIYDNPMMSVNKQMNVYVTLAEFFLNAATVYKNKKIEQPNLFMQSFLNCNISSEEFNQCLLNAYSSMFDMKIAQSICKTVEQYNYSIWKMDKVTDDRTIVCAINEDMLISTESPEYYAEPDWKVLQQQFDRLAYPSLYDENDMVQIGEYAKVSLPAKDDKFAGTKRKDAEKLELKTEHREKVCVPVTRAASVQGAKTYQSVRRKKTKINIICVLAIVLFVGGAIAGAKIIKDKSNSKGDFFSDKTGEESEIVLGKLEDEKPDTEKENETEYSSAEADDSEADVADNHFIEKSDKFDNHREREEKTSEQSDSVDIDDREFKTEFALSGEKFLFPCNLVELKDKYTLIPSEENEEYKIYSYSGTNIVVKVKTVLRKENSNNQISGEGINAYSTETTEHEEKIENISLALRNNNAMTIQQNSVSEERMAVIYCDEKCVAELGMSQDEFIQSQSDFEWNTSMKWTEEMRAYTHDYRLEYGDITYIISIRDGIVCEITLQLNAE